MATPPPMGAPNGPLFPVAPCSPGGGGGGGSSAYREPVPNERQKKQVRNNILVKKRFILKFFDKNKQCFLKTSRLDENFSSNNLSLRDHPDNVVSGWGVDGNLLNR